ncbi:MAG: small basic protein [Phycisphaera sp.]|nr:small basic protein [Phycisphaera sp.]
MSLHSSLKTKSGALNQHRNVLTRAERITKLQDKDGFVAGESSPLGIPKVRSIKISAGKKKPAKAEEAEGKE